MGARHIFAAITGRGQAIAPTMLRSLSSQIVHSREMACPRPGSHTQNLGGRPAPAMGLTTH